MILNLRKERSISSLQIPLKTLNNIYENAIILIKEEIYGEFIIKEMEYKYLMLLIEVINV
jgi:hypothetical protein